MPITIFHSLQKLVLGDAEAPEQPEEPAYTQGEKLADATSFDKMLTGIFDSGFKWVPMTDGAAENPVTYVSY